jgi:hypothetical protein
MESMDLNGYKEMAEISGSENASRQRIKHSELILDTNKNDRERVTDSPCWNLLSLSLSLSLSLFVCVCVCATTSVSFSILFIN